MRNKVLAASATAILATLIAIGGATAAQALKVSGAGPFTTLTRCNGERAIWRSDGWTPSVCYTNNAGNTWWFTATK